MRFVCDQHCPEGDFSQATDEHKMDLDEAVETTEVDPEETIDEQTVSERLEALEVGSALNFKDGTVTIRRVE